MTNGQDKAQAILKDDRGLSMSVITDIILSVAVIEVGRLAELEGFSVIDKINDWLGDNDYDPLTRLDNLVEGRRILQACIYGGANNGFSLCDFIGCLESQKWRDRDRLQLFVKEENDERFSAYMFDRDGKIKKFWDGYDKMPEPL